MHRSLAFTCRCLLSCSLLVSSNALAGDEPDKKDSDNKPEGSFTTLTEEEAPAEAAPKPAKPDKPKPVDYSPYRDPGKEQQVAAPSPSEGEGGGGTSASLAWMKDWKPRFASRRAVAEFEVFSSEYTQTYTWDVVLNLGVADAPVFLDIDLPWTYMDAGSVDQLHFGNIVLGMHGGGVVADVVGIWGGLSVGIMTIGNDSDLDDEERARVQSLKTATLLRASLARANVESHRFMTGFIPLRFAVGVEAQIHPLVYLRSSFYPVVAIPGETYSDLGFLVGGYMDQINEAEFISPIGLGAGLRFQEFFVMTTCQGNCAQVAMEPYITYEPPYEGPFGFPMVARVGLLFALDKPLGFGFDEGDESTGDVKVATFRTAVGARF